jgi:hypothetical protein
LEGDVIRLSHIVAEITDKKIEKLLASVFSSMDYEILSDFVLSKDGFFKEQVKRIFKENPNASEQDIEFEFEDWIDIKWKQKILKVNPSNFTKTNLKHMVKRKFGYASLKDIPNDDERNKDQRNLLKKLKSEEIDAVIVLKHGSEYRLLEGWHRTMAILSSGNNGETDPTKWDTVKLNAWVGTGSSVKNIW